MWILNFIYSPTCQGALTLWQVEDFMKGSSLGAVVPSAVLLPTDHQGWSAGTPPTPSCRKLWWWTGRKTGFTNQSQAPGSPLQVRQPFYFLSVSIRHHLIVSWSSQCDENVAFPNSCLWFGKNTSTQFQARLRKKNPCTENTNFLTVFFLFFWGGGSSG